MTILPHGEVELASTGMNGTTVFRKDLTNDTSRFSIDADTTDTFADDDDNTCSTEIADNLHSTASSLARPLLRTIPLATIVFYTVSGGPFGSEGSIKAGGVFYALVGFLVMPIIWSLPEAMVTAELGSTFPEASGSVAWVEEAFGREVSWMEGYLKWVAGVTDNAIYPTLFLDYLLQVIKLKEKIRRGPRFVLLASTSIILAYINWLGLEIVGNMAVSICLISMSPFLILSIAGAWKVDPQNWFQLPVSISNSTWIDPSEDVGGGFFPNARLGGILWRPFLNNLFWNLNSFDSAASFSGDVEDVGRVFPRAMFLSVIMVTCSYFIPLLIATGASHTRQQDWVDGYLATVATNVAGPFLGAWTVFAAGISNVALFQAEMSSDAFQVMGMADRGLIPKVFSTRSRHGTPTIAILLGTTIIVIMSATDFAKLTEMLNFNYSISLLLEYSAFIKLRMSKPDSKFSRT
jgi:amino acid transporter